MRPNAAAIVNHGVGPAVCCCTLKAHLPREWLATNPIFSSAFLATLVSSVASSFVRIKCAGNYVLCRRSGNTLYFSGHLPKAADGKLMCGKVFLFIL